MKSNKRFLTILAVAFGTLALNASPASAAFINGAITFAGGAIYDTMSLATATRVDNFVDVKVMSDDGDFASFVNVGDSVTMAQPWIFTPSTPTPGLWSVGGFTFDLDGSTVVLQNSDFLIISGSGTVSGNGFDPTPMTWNFTSQSPDANGVFSFSASGNAGGVPDGGTTVALLGIGLIGLESLRRKLAMS